MPDDLGVASQTHPSVPEASPDAATSTPTGEGLHGPATSTLPQTTAAVSSVEHSSSFSSNPFHAPPSAPSIPSDPMHTAQSGPPGGDHPHSGGSFISMILLVIVSLAIGAAGGWFLRGQSMFGAVSPDTQNETQISDGSTVIKIGGIMPLTGDAATYGIPYQKVAQLAQKQINETGGVDGKQIEMFWEDGQCEIEPAQIAANSLINEKNVQFLIGGACSSEYIGAGPIASQKKVISFSPSATSPKISEMGRYIFRTASSDALAGRVAAQYASSKWNAKTAGVIAENTDYALGLKDVFEKEFQGSGGQIVFSDVYETGVTDFSDLVKKAKQSPPDIIYVLPQTPTPGVLVVSALRQAAVPSKLLTAEVLMQRDVIEKQGKLLEGVTGVEIVFDDTRAKTQAFFSAYKEEYGLEVTDPAYMSAMYDIMYLIKEAYQAGNGDTEKIADYLYGLKNWEGAVGTLSFDENGDPSFPYSIREAKGNEAVQIEVFTPIQ